MAPAPVPLLPYLLLLAPVVFVVPIVLLVYSHQIQLYVHSLGVFRVDYETGLPILYMP